MYRLIGKRVFDIVLSVISLVFLAPFMLVVGFLIKVFDPGPIFFLQKRVGRDGKHFDFYKFRSMPVNTGDIPSDKLGAVKIGPIGRFIRRTNADELPQLINILKGDMSFVGPRPERPLFVDQLTQKIPYYSLRHTVKPGITGWAQVCYPYGASEEDALRKLEYDLYYIKNQSLLLDFFIIFSTVKTVLFQKGSR